MRMSSLTKSEENILGVYKDAKVGKSLEAKASGCRDWGEK